MKTYEPLTRPEAWLPYAVAAMFAVLLFLVLVAVYAPTIAEWLAPLRSAFK